MTEATFTLPVTEADARWAEARASWRANEQAVVANPETWEQTGDWQHHHFSGVLPDELLVDIILSSIAVPKGWSRRDYTVPDDQYDRREILLENDQYAVRIWTVMDSDRDQQFAGVHFFRKDKLLPEFDEAISIATPLFSGKVALSHGGRPFQDGVEMLHGDAFAEVSQTPDAPFGFTISKSETTQPDPEKHYAIKLRPIPAFRGPVR